MFVKGLGVTTPTNISDCEVNNSLQGFFPKVRLIYANV